MKGYFFDVDEHHVLYFPEFLVVIGDDEPSNFVMDLDDVHLFDSYWSRQQICLFEDGIINRPDIIRHCYGFSIGNNHLEDCLDNYLAGDLISSKEDAFEMFRYFKYRFDEHYASNDL